MLCARFFSLRTAVVLCALCWIPMPKVAAFDVRPLSIETLTRQAEVVLHGKVLSKTCQQDAAGRIYTRIELDVIDVWKGAISGTPFSVVQGGGVLGERQSVIPGQAEYGISEEVVVFLVRNGRGEAVTVGLLQGKFHVEADAKSGTKAAFYPFHGALGGLNSAKLLPLESLKKQVLEARE